MKRIPEYLTIDELSSLLATPYKTNIQHIIIMRLMAQSGLRVSEAIRVKPKDKESFPQYAKLTIRQGKGKKDRIVPVTIELSGIIDNYIKTNDIPYVDYLFPGVRTNTITTSAVRQFVKGYGLRAGIQKDIHPHMLRHTYAVLYLKAGGNLRSLQKNLGHSSLTTTQIYLEITEDDRFEDFIKHPVVI